MLLKDFVRSEKMPAFFIASMVAAFSLMFLLLMPSSCAYAEQDSDTRTFTQQITADAPLFRVGEQAQIKVNLTCVNFETYPMYAYASTIRVDTNVLRIDAIEARKDVDVTTVPAVDAEGKSGWTNVVINYRSRSLSGSPWLQDETVVTLTVTPLSTGSVSVATSRVNVSNSTGMSRMPCACTDFSMVIDETLPIAIRSDSYVSASDFSLVSYEGAVSSGMVPCYKDRLFVWDGSRFIALIESADISGALSSDFFSKEAEADLIVSGDANSSGVVNIIDAQIAYDVAQGRFVDFSLLPLKGWLSCDVNKDGLVDAADAYAIQAKAILHRFE